MFSRCVRAILIPLVICTLALPAVPVAPAYGQAGSEPLPAKPARDLPIPAVMTAEQPMTAAAPLELPRLPPQAVAADAAAAQDAAQDAADPLAVDVSRWSRLAYQSLPTGDWEIYAANGDGSAPLNLSNHPAADARAQLSLDGTRVVFNSNRDGNAEIYTVNAGGSGLTRLTYTSAADYAPAWSPDSRRIVFVSDRTGNNELFLMNADGSGVGQWIRDDASDSSPTWSPDGQWIAWKRTAANGLSSLLMMHPDGSGFTPLANGLRYVGDLSWSPTSDKLLFDADLDNDRWNEVGELVYSPVDGWSVRVLADFDSQMIDLWAGAYAPDGGSILYTIVQYQAYGPYLLVRQASLVRSSLSGGPPSSIPGFGLDINPSWRSIDWAAPATQVSPLPPFVHAGQVTLQLEGGDNGPSGIRAFDVQSAPAADGPWTNLAADFVTATLELPPIEPGMAVWLRARAKDYAGNVEAWPAVPDTGTQVYAWDVSARGVDSRGLWVSNPTITGSADAVSTVATGRGGYRLLYGAERAYTLGITASGFGAAPPATLALNNDAQLDLFLPPNGELLQNGGFEDGLNGWAGDGTLVTGDLAQGAHSGSHGLLLGPDCVLWCVQGPLAHDLPLANRGVATVDRQGNYHVLQTGGVFYSWQLRYQVRSLATGQWSELDIIEYVPLSSGGYISEMDIAVDGKGTVYIVVVTAQPERGFADRLYSWYAQKPLGGTWSYFTPLIGLLDNQDEAVVLLGDPAAGVHLLIDHRFYQQGSTHTIWPGTIDIFPRIPGKAIPYGAMALDAEGNVHFLADLDGAVTYRVLSAQQTLSNPVVLWNDAASHEGLGLAATADGSVHAIMGTSYRYRRPGGVWSQPQAVAYQGGDAPAGVVMQVDAAGRLYLFGQTGANGRSLLAVKSPDVGWLPVQYTSISGDTYLNTVTVANSGAIQILAEDSGGSDYVYWGSPLGSTGVISSVAQAVTLPAQTVRPTLSFFHKAISGDPHGQARLAVTVDDGGGPTVVYTTTAAAAWTHTFADLEPWLGKTITLTLAVEQADGEPPLAVYLDDLSLGEWTTPLVRSVEPAQMDNGWDGALLTVRGDNFTPGSDLSLGAAAPEVTLPTTFVDARTLQAALPAGLAAGHYTVWVQNPDGRQGAAEGGLTLGSWQYLPTIRR